MTVNCPFVNGPRVEQNILRIFFQSWYQTKKHANMFYSATSHYYYSAASHFEVVRSFWKYFLMRTNFFTRLKEVPGSLIRSQKHSWCIQFCQRNVSRACLFDSKYLRHNQKYINNKWITRNKKSNSNHEKIVPISHTNPFMWCYKVFHHFQTIYGPLNTNCSGFPNMGKGNSPHQSENDKILSLKVSPSHQRPLSPNFYCLPIRLLGSHHCYLEWGIKVREKVIKILYNKMRQFSRKPLKKNSVLCIFTRIDNEIPPQGENFYFPY